MLWLKFRPTDCKTDGDRETEAQTHICISNVHQEGYGFIGVYLLVSKIM